ncbi:MAG: isoprenylcysteine carboxylmethyltransferase family protein [Candidatus Marinimicrobia bacterium]|nr:isoprenylcysteine carboxylmethyltransferase family protein [Candidatus Neomarinimicrobiota bacterium]
MDIRNIFFKYRGITPLPFVILLIVQSDMTRWGVVSGLVLSAIGELIRISGVRVAGGRTRTRKVGARKLCTGGIYSYVRNPLYLGNVIIYMGFALFAGGLWVFYLMFIALIYFVFQYGMIISLEEKTLADLFGENYQEYRQNVHRLFPRFTAWQPDKTIERVSWNKVIRAEKSTLINQCIFLIVILIKEIIVHRLHVI